MRSVSFLLSSAQLTSQLVQTGKALRSSRKDGQPMQPLQPKLPQTLIGFHSALDKLENDIVSTPLTM